MIVKSAVALRVASGGLKKSSSYDVPARASACAAVRQRLDENSGAGASIRAACARGTRAARSGKLCPAKVSPALTIRSFRQRQPAQ